MDHILAGAITDIFNDRTPSPSDFVLTLLRDPVGSHVFEVVVERCPERVFSNTWEQYIMPHLARLAPHPVSNFVVSRCIPRLSDIGFTEFMERMLSHWIKIVSSGRSGILLSVINRSCGKPFEEELAMNVSI